MHRCAICLTALATLAAVTATPTFSQSTSPQVSGLNLLLEASRWNGAPIKQVKIASNAVCADVLKLILGETARDITPTGAERLIREKYGSPADGPRVGALVVLSRGSTGNHIGIVRGTVADGNPILVSGNLGSKVVERTFPKKDVGGYFVVDRCPTSDTR